MLPAVLPGAFTPPAIAAEQTVIDRIVAVVEDEAIFKSDIEQLIKQYMLQQGQTDISSEDRSALFQQILNELINDKLIIAQAGRLDVSIPFSDVEERVDKAIEDNTRALGSKEAFDTQLEREGFTMESLKNLYREQIRNRMLVQRVLEIDVPRQSADVGDAELRRLYEEKHSELPQRPAVVNLRTIFIGFDSSQNARLAAKEKIDQLHARAVAGEEFSDLARAASEDPSAALGGDLGFVKPEDLADSTFAAVAAKLEVGEVSDPVLTPYGYHIVKATDKNPAAGEVRISHILVRMSASEQDVEAVFAKIAGIQRQLDAGVPFEKLADEYSTDPTASAGGDLGWLKVSDLPEFFQDVLAGMKPGDVSQILRESTGFRIVKLVEREEARPYEYEEVKQELRKLYDQERLEGVYTEYLEGLRKKFTVELHLND